jgi:inner membrane protein
LGWLLGALVLLAVPLSLVRGLVVERQQRAADVGADVAAYAGHAQRLVGPLLVLPYRQVTRKLRPAGESSASQWVIEEARREVVLQPADLSAEFDMDTELLRRGIYAVPLFRATTSLRGEFSVPARTVYELADTADTQHEYEWGEPRLVVGVADRRGISGLEGTAADGPLVFQPGSGMAWIDAGVHAPLALPREGGMVPFTVGLRLSGTQGLQVIPLGRHNAVAIRGTWPHPSFIGGFAPAGRTVDAGGFSVTWEVDDWATGITADTIAACGAGASCPVSGPDAASVGVRLVDPVDHYLLSERTAKYGELFILLTFAAFFLVEVLQSLRLHPAQYALVGLALALFFLLTLSLGEHIGFTYAYWLAAALSMSLLTIYGAAVLQSRLRGALFGGGLAVIYVALFVILKSEDNALLLGSILLFVVLGTVMLVTRKLDWYALPGMDPQGEAPRA